MSTPPIRARHVGMVVHAYYDEDPRVRRQAESLVRAGWRVHVVALRRPKDEPTGELNGVAVTRLEISRHQGAGLPTYLIEYARFALGARGAILAIARRDPFDVVIVHSPPDWLALALRAVRASGAALVLDSHEATTEFFRFRFGRRLPGRILGAVVEASERLSLRACDFVLTTTPMQHRRLLDLGADPARSAVLLNAPSVALFDSSRVDQRPFAADGVVRLVYTGALTPAYEIEAVLRAMRELALDATLPRVTLDVYGRGDSASMLRSLTVELGLADLVQIHQRLPLEKVGRVLAGSDIVVSPTRLTPHTDLAIATKDLEALAMAKPLVSAGLSGARELLPDEYLWRYRPGDIGALCAAIRAIIADPPAATARAAAGQAFVGSGLLWEQQVPGYLAIMESLAGAAAARPAALALAAPRQ